MRKKDLIGPAVSLLIGAMTVLYSLSGYAYGRHAPVDIQMQAAPAGALCYVAYGYNVNNNPVVVGFSCVR